MEYIGFVEKRRVRAEYAPRMPTVFLGAMLSEMKRVCGLRELRESATKRKESTRYRWPPVRAPTPFAFIIYKEGPWRC